MRDGAKVGRAMLAERMLLRALLNRMGVENREIDRSPFPAYLRARGHEFALSEEGGRVAPVVVRGDCTACGSYHASRPVASLAMLDAPLPELAVCP